MQAYCLPTEVEVDLFVLESLASHQEKGALLCYEHSLVATVMAGGEEATHSLPGPFQEDRSAGECVLLPGPCDKKKFPSITLELEVLKLRRL